METAVPFRAWRYGPTAGECARLIAPPYDVIGPELQSRLYASSPHNVVRVDLGMTTPSDNDCDNQYTRAASQLAQWKSSGVLVRDREPALTFVEERFTGPDGKAKRRLGFLAAMRLYDFDEGVVFPHEQTLTGPKEDRFRLITATAMSLSPVFMLYELPGDEISHAWQERLGKLPPTVAIDDAPGSAISLWSTSDTDLLVEVTDRLTSARFIIADGHHRYETALRYRDLQRSTHGGDSDHPAYEYCLAYFSNGADPALAIYPTHRLVAGLDDQKVAALPEALSEWFKVERLTEDAVTAELAQAATVTYLLQHRRKAFTIWGRSLPGVYGLRLDDPTKALLQVPGRSRAFQELDVSILQTLVFERALGMTAADMAGERFVSYSRDPADAFTRVAAGEFQAGIFVNPPGLDQVRQVAFGGERMPQKATFFYPKLPTGLVFHDLSSTI